MFKNLEPTVGIEPTTCSELHSQLGAALPTALNIFQKCFNAASILTGFQGSLQPPCGQQCVTFLPTRHGDRQHPLRRVNVSACVLTIPTDQVICRSDVIPSISLGLQHIHERSHYFQNWSQRSESNRRPAVYETAALPAELRWRNCILIMPCLRFRASNSTRRCAHRIRPIGGTVARDL